MSHWYSVQPFLAWCLNHYFYNRAHYVYISAAFYPYRFPNPRSSNPCLIYQQLYESWKDIDDSDKFVAQTRISLRKGVLRKGREGVLDTRRMVRLSNVCDQVGIVFIYPVVYRINIDSIDPMRRRQTPWSQRGSEECLVTDLAEHEFDVLFLDFEGDSDFDALKSGTAIDPLSILEGRC